MANKNKITVEGTEFGYKCITQILTVWNFIRITCALCEILCVPCGRIINRKVRKGVPQGSQRFLNMLFIAPTQQYSNYANANIAEQ